jgi:hypothetical protein
MNSHVTWPLFKPRYVKYAKLTLGVFGFVVFFVLVSTVDFGDPFIVRS